MLISIAFSAKKNSLESKIVYASKWISVGQLAHVCERRSPAAQGRRAGGASLNELASPFVREIIISSLSSRMHL
jgi:hypothetical protein